MFESVDAIVGAGCFAGVVEMAGHCAAQDVIGEGGLATATGTAEADQLAERDADIEILEVVLAGVSNFQFYDGCRS